MAIKLPDPGNGIPEQKTGNDEWTNMKIVRDNFADQSNAASRLVGTANGNLLEAGVNGIARMWDRRTEPNREKPSTLMGTGLSLSLDGGDAASPYTSTSIYSSLNLFPFGSSNGLPAFHRITLRDSRIYVQQSSSDLQSWSKSSEFYTTGNTTKDSNGFIKASSPVLRVFSDHIEGNDDGESMSAEFVKKGVGDYLIKGTTGLADEGWYVTIPQDANGNNLVAVEYESLENGDVALRTYKRKFDFETVSIVADHDNPLDIPDTRWVDLRFNELEQEQLDEPI